MYKTINEQVPRIPEKWSDSFADFIDKCLIKDPVQRWTIEQLLAHEFLEDAEFERETWSNEFTNW